MQTALHSSYPCTVIQIRTVQYTLAWAAIAALQAASTANFAKLLENRDGTTRIAGKACGQRDGCNVPVALHGGLPTNTIGSIRSDGAIMS